VTPPSLEPPVPDPAWLCELSTAATLPAGEAEDTGVDTGAGAAFCAEVTTASCRKSRPATRKTAFIDTFISGISPLL
jgi:hypothetical protein